jgi:thiol-disulfide isomerase/thioredoxin
MRPLSFMPSLAVGLALIGLLHAGNSAVLAQSNSLKMCSQDLQRSRQAIYKSSKPNEQALSPLMSSTFQKLQQVYEEWAQCIKGQKVPLLPFKTLDGKAYDSTSLTGKIVVVNFWFVGCAPCRAEMPALNKLVEEYKGKDVLFFGFATDKADRLTPAFFSKHRFDFSVVADAQNLARSFYVTGYPTTFIIDGQGLIHQAWVGYMDENLDPLSPYHKAKSAIDHLLAEAKK